MMFDLLLPDPARTAEPTPLLVPVPDSGPTRADRASVVAYLVMLALVAAFLVALGAGALL